MIFLPSDYRHSPFAMTSCSKYGRRHRCRCTPPPAAAAAAVTTHHLAILLFRMSILTFCQCDAFPKLFEPKSHKVARLTAELAALEAERLSKYVVVFGYEFDKLGFFSTVSISTVLLVAGIIQLSRSRKKWKRLALSGAVNEQDAASISSTIVSSARYATILTLILGVAVLFYVLTFKVANKSPVHSKTNKFTRSERGGISQHRLSDAVIVFGQYELDKTTFCALVSTSVVMLVALGAQIGIWCKKQQLQKLEDAANLYPTTDKSVDVVIIGCGPKSVGWFHLMQFLDMPNVTVRAIVEPFYLDTSKCPYPPQSFVDLVVMLDDMGIRCVNHVGRLDVFLQHTLCVVAGRTSDNPRFFRECIGHGASHIYLESPGAPTIEQLHDMQTLAETRGVEVYMGYQRVCASYIQKAVSLSRSVPKAHIFFCHNEIHQSNELNKVVSRHPVGMIHSMAVQELAILVMQFGVKAKEIETFKVNTNRLFSERLTFNDENNSRKVTDLSRVAFKITTKDRRRSVSIMADRCGGVVSFAVVKSHAGKELQRFQSHNADHVSMIQSQLRDDMEISHQFDIESEEYLELKRRIVKSILSTNSQESFGLVSVRDGVDIMELADYCSGEINAALKPDD